jgi:hypothetical protein
MNGEVEQAHIDKTPLLILLFETENPLEVLAGNEKGLKIGPLKGWRLTEERVREEL